MKIRLFGANHETADMAFRESLSLTETKKIEFLEALMETDLKESVVLSTCGRFELYVVDRKDDLAMDNDQMIRFIERFFDLENAHKHFYMKEEQAVIMHLFKVAAGLDSAVLGEDQILGQTKDAAQFALTVGSSGKVLNKLFQEAVTAAKEIKTSLKISDHPLSLSYIAVKKAKQLLGNLEDRTVLMLGLGKMGQLAMKTLLDEGVSSLICAVRNPSKLDTDLLKDERVSLVSFDDRYLYIEKADIIIGATSAPHIILRSKYAKGFKKGAVLLDLALPRDFDPEIQNKFDVHLLDVDALKDISEENQNRRQELGQQAEIWLSDSAAAFTNWLSQSQVDHVLNKWHDDISEIHDETMAYLSKKLSNLNHRELALIDKMLDASLKRFIRKPLKNLKNMEDNDARSQAIALLEELFTGEDEE